MNNAAAKKAYDKVIAQFRALNNAEDSCQNEAEYAALKDRQKTERHALQGRLDYLRRCL